jgi:hypothetical protein
LVTQVFRALLASRGVAEDVSRDDAECARRQSGINTSLSGTLFFLMCWCMREEVHFDSRVHAAMIQLTYSEGTMAKKAKAKKATKTVKKAKTAKSAVKKTAKKTKKVAKKAAKKK